MTRARLLGAWIALGFLAACSGGDGGGPAYEISDQPLQGTINGNPWTFGSGVTDAFLSEGEDDYFTQVYAESVACPDFPPSTDHIIVSVPKETGEYRLNNFLNMTFVFYENGDAFNYVAFTGRIEVNAVAGTSLSAGLHAIYEGDPDFEVDGLFTATICES